MAGRPRRAFLPTAAAALLLVTPARAGRLDLHSADPPPLPRSTTHYAVPAERWALGDPRNERGEGPIARTVATAGMTGLSAAGLATAVVAGAVAPGSGFGIVLVYQLLKLRPARPGVRR